MITDSFAPSSRPKIPRKSSSTLDLCIWRCDDSNRWPNAQSYLFSRLSQMVTELLVKIGYLLFHCRRATVPNHYPLLLACFRKICLYLKSNTIHSKPTANIFWYVHQSNDFQALADNSDSRNASQQNSQVPYTFLQYDNNSVLVHTRTAIRRMRSPRSSRSQSNLWVPGRSRSINVTHCDWTIWLNMTTWYSLQCKLAYHKSDSYLTGDSCDLNSCLVEINNNGADLWATGEKSEQIIKLNKLWLIEEKLMWSGETYDSELASNWRYWASQWQWICITETAWQFTDCSLIGARSGSLRPWWSPLQLSSLFLGGGGGREGCSKR